MPSPASGSSCAECSGPLETVTVWQTTDSVRVSSWTESCCVDQTCPRYDVAVEPTSETPTDPGVS